MPSLVILDNGDGDPVKVASALLDGGQWQRIDGGWLVTDEDRGKSAHRDRQRRYRDRKRVTRDGPAGVTRDALRDAGFDLSGGEDQSLPTSVGGREGVTDTPRRDVSDASQRDAGDARNGDARHVGNADVTWRLPDLSDEDRDFGRAEAKRIADELRQGKR
jgi:hypothetical protein